MFVGHECEWLSECCGAEPATDCPESAQNVGIPLASIARGIAPGMIPKPVQSADAYSRTRNQGASTAPQVIA
jgi:hypothetical protein